MKHDTASPQLSGCLSEAVKLISSGVFSSLPAEVEEILQGIAFVIHGDFHLAHVKQTLSSYFSLGILLGIETTA